MPRQWPRYPRLLGLSVLALVSIAGSLIFTGVHNASLAAVFGFTGLALSLAAFIWAVVLMAQRHIWLWLMDLVFGLVFSVLSLFAAFPYPWSFLALAFSPLIVLLTAIFGPTKPRSRRKNSPIPPRSA